jgi:hypothetical protein
MQNLARVMSLRDVYERSVTSLDRHLEGALGYLVSWLQAYALGCYCGILLQCFTALKQSLARTLI